MISIYLAAIASKQTIRSYCMKRISQFILISILYFLSANISFADYTYSPKTCEYQVSFPSTPKIKDVSVENYFHQSATLVLKEIALRASCSIFKDEGVFDVSDKALVDWAKDWTSRMGLTLPEISIENTSMGRLLRIKGSKLLQGEQTIVSALIYHGSYSRLAIVVGAPASIYPTMEIIKFIKTVRKN